MAFASLVEQLRSMSQAEIVALLSARPDLVEPPPSDVVALAERANAPYQLERVMRRLTGFERELLHGLVWLGGRESESAAGGGVVTVGFVTVDMVEALAATTPPVGSVLTGLHRLRTLGLAGVNRDGRWALTSPVGEGASIRPFGLGPRLDRRLARAASAELSLIAANLGLDSGGTKAELVGRITALLASPGGFASAMERLPQGCLSFVRAVDEGGGLFQTTDAALRHVEQIRALMSIGVLLPFGGNGFALSCDVQLVLRGGHPLQAWTVTAPIVIAQSAAEESGSTQSQPPPRRTVGDLDPSICALVLLPPGAASDTIARFGLRWRDSPVNALKTGGMGVKELRALSVSIGLDERSTARLVEFGALAGLLGMRAEQSVEVKTAGRSRRPVLAAPVDVLGPTATFDPWVAQGPAPRWWALVRTWFTCPWDVSRAGRRAHEDDKAIAPMSWAWEQPGDLVAIRKRVLSALLDVPAGIAVDRAALVRHVLWLGFEPFGEASEDPFTRVVDVLAEAALLGLVTDDGSDGLTPAGRRCALALVGSDTDLATFSPNAFVSAALDTFTVQADLTAIAPGELDVGVRTELGLLADVESTGAATVLRFSEASLRRALDAGRDAETIVNFLDTHARPSVPQSLRYLVDDVARRHGGLRIGTCTSYIRSDDQALLAEVFRQRKLAKAELQQLAPTVLISSLPTKKLLQQLREAGFLPVEEGPGGVVLGRTPVDVPSTGAGGAAGAGGRDPATRGSGSEFDLDRHAAPLPHVEPSTLRRLQQHRTSRPVDQEQLLDLARRLVARSASRET